MDWLMLIKTFAVGGIICVLGQLLIDYTLAKGAEEMVKEKGLLGALMGGLSGTAGGISAAILFGFVCALVSKSGDKS